jgi:hypothetical protein
MQLVVCFEIFLTFIVVVCDMEKMDPLSTDKMLQLLTKSISDVDNDKSDKDENTKEEICSEDGIKEEAKDKMNSFYLGKNKTTK